MNIVAGVVDTSFSLGKKLEQITSVHCVGGMMRRRG